MGFRESKIILFAHKHLKRCVRMCVWKRQCVCARAPVCV